jgi:simple sugar transport system substrate-binding protein
VIETAEKRGIYSSGYHANQSDLAPQGYLTGAEWDWSSIYTQFAQDFLAGKSLMSGDIPHLLRGGLGAKFCKMSPYGSAVTEAAQADADAAREAILNDELVIYEGPLKTNTGDEILSDGAQYKQQDLELEKMDYLIEGVDGSIPS